MTDFPVPTPDAPADAVADWIKKADAIADQHLNAACTSHRTHSQKLFRLAAETYEAIASYLEGRALFPEKAHQSRVLAFACRQGESSGFLDLNARPFETRH
jgi:hypothetical protein